MSKFNTRTTRAQATSPVTTTGRATTYEGGSGFTRDAKSDLYLLAVTNMVAESTFYEKAEDRDTRFADLVRTVALDDPSWVAGFFPWLRSEGFMRSASVVGAAEAAKALADANRYDRIAEMIDGSLLRPDEVGEFLAYWFSIAGKAKPSRYDAVYEGLKRATVRMYSERNWLKYDSDKRGIRFADAIQVIHPKPKDQRQQKLFKYILDARYQGTEASIPDELVMLHTQAAWRAEAARLRQGNVPAQTKQDFLTMLLNPERVKLAGLTWEDVLPALSGAVEKADLWSSVIPSMGTMALIRNLRNMDEAGVNQRVADDVARRIADPEEIKRSKQFPFRFLAAHQAVHSLRWGHVLEQALTHSLSNVPELKGNTLILVDRSGSMFGGLSKQTQLNRADSAALFGSALALRAEKADLVEFGTTHNKVMFRRGESVLRMVEKFRSLGGTNTAQALKDSFKGHDRVVILTDEQAYGYGYGYGQDVGSMLPARVPLYTWNLAGYSVAHSESGKSNRHTFGGLSDASFRLIPLLERGRSAKWPWQ